MSWDLPNSADSMLADQARRIYDLEQMFRAAREQHTFQMPGPLVAGEQSDPFSPRSELIIVLAKLKLAGSTNTVVTMRKNAISLGTVTIVPPTKYTLWTVALPYPTFTFPSDDLFAETTTIGTGAEGLVVQCYFGL